jgi:uroporphyrinogen-III decarboxylase
MNSKQRMAAAMRRQQPDRTPVMCQLSIGHMLLVTGIDPVELWFTPEAFVQALQQTASRYHFDGVLLNVQPADPDWRYRVREIPREGAGQVVYWKEGGRMVFPPDDLPYVDGEVPPYRELSEVDTASLVDRYAVPYRVDSVKLAAATMGRELSIHGEVPGPMNYLVGLVGVEGAMMALMDEPQRSREVFGLGADCSVRSALAQIQAGADAIDVSSPYVGAAFISKQHYEQFVLPCERQLVTAIHSQAPDIPVYVHTCGAIGDRLELMAQSGYDGLECMDPPPLGNVELAEAVQRVGHRMFLKGNLDSVGVLLCGSQQDVDRAVRRCLDEGRNASGYILSTACSVAPRVPPERLERLVEFV